MTFSLSSETLDTLKTSSTSLIFFHHHQQVSKWQRNWNGQDSSVSCLNPLGHKTKAKVAKFDKKKQPAKKPKAKGLVVLSEFALTEAEQLKLATKRSKKDFHISHASFLGDGVDTQSKVPGEQHLNTSGADEGTGTIPGVLDVPVYESESKKESWGDSGEEDEDDESDYVDKSDGDDNDDGSSDDNDEESIESDRDEILNPNLTNVDQTEHEEEDVDEGVHAPLEYELIDDEKIFDKENIDEEEEDEVTKELYDDVNVNLGNEDTEMTNKTRRPTQSSSVCSDFTSKLLNLDNPSPIDNEIASSMDTTAHHATAIPEITSSFTTPTPPPPLFFNPLSQQETPTSTPMASEIITSLLTLPDFASVFKFNERVTNLEKNLSEIKQVDQYAQALSSITAIVDRYIDNKLGEAINKAIQAHNFDCKEEAHAEKRECIELVDSMVRTIIKKEVNAQLPQILPQSISNVATPVIKKNVTESLEAAVLTRCSSQPRSSYEAAATL
nr:hypothetical protein [Tanacetum cinerariifolium]